MQIKEITQREYADFWETQPNHSFLNSSEQATKLKQRWNVRFLAYVDEETNTTEAACLLVIAQCMKFFKYGTIPHGYVMDWKNQQLVEDFTNDLYCWAMQNKLIFLKINPYVVAKMYDRDENIVYTNNVYKEIFTHLDMEHLGYYDKQDPVYLSVLPLRNKDWQTILKEMDQQTRWSINRTKKYDFEIVEATTDEQFEEFAKCMEHTGERNHFVSHTADYYKQTIKAYGNKARLYLCYLNKEKLQLSQEAIIYDAQLELSNLEQKPHSKKTKKRMNVLHEDIARAQKIIDDTKDLPSKVLLAGSMFITMGGEMTYLYSGAYSQYMKYNAPYALHAHAIQTALKEGVEVYSMYGIQPDWKDGDGHGLYAFKRGFGCSVIELVGEWVIPVHETTYKLYKLAQPDLFPPYEEDEEELDTIDLLTMPAHADKNTEETNV